MFFNCICRFYEACGDGINEVGRRGHPFAFGIVVNRYFRAAIVGDLGARFEGLEVGG